MARPLKTGDRVGWRSSGAGASVASSANSSRPAKIKRHEVAASEDNPEYLVRSEKSGKIAAHKPAALRRVK